MTWLSAGSRRRWFNNTWFDAWDTLEVNRLRNQLVAAQAIGCEVFVVDAGWYGRSDKGWWANVGDWREQTARAFHGCMREFADEVRAAGLAFGIWMEPERLTELAPGGQGSPGLVCQSVRTLLSRSGERQGVCLPPV